ncbi:MAG: hypothetical protein ABWZ76_07725 [Acidimicrobiales bacterium]
MEFVQIIEFRSTKLDEMRKLGEEWEKAAADDSRAGRRIMCQDRDEPGRFFNLVFFETYEEAMKNSELPVTQEYSGKMAALVDGPPTFHNLDIVEDTGA